MTLPQADVVNGLVNELRWFQTLIASLSERDWARPTICDAWTVGDLAAHVVGVMADITAGRLEGIDTQEWYDRQVAERRGRSPRSLVEELSGVVKATVDLMASLDEQSWNGPGPPGVAETLGAGVEALWCGFYIHAEDILAAVGRPPQNGPGIRAAVSHIGAVLDRARLGPGDARPQRRRGSHHRRWRTPDLGRPAHVHARRYRPSRPREPGSGCERQHLQLTYGAHPGGAFSEPGSPHGSPAATCK